MLCCATFAPRRVLSRHHTCKATAAMCVYAVRAAGTHMSANRLAMEPGVAAVLCQQADPAAVVAAQQSGKGVGPCPTQQSPPPATSEIQPSLSSNSSHSQSTGDLCLLLGQQISQDLFYQSHWERQPLLCRAPQDASHSSGAQTLAEALTPSGVLEHLLPRAPHCPVLPACMEDPVQVRPATVRCT